MTEQQVTITLDADVVERLMEEPLTKPVGYSEKAPLSLDEFVNQSIRQVPRPSLQREKYREQMVRAGEER